MRLIYVVSQEIRPVSFCKYRYLYTLKKTLTLTSLIQNIQCLTFPFGAKGTERPTKPQNKRKRRRKWKKKNGKIKKKQINGLFGTTTDYVTTLLDSMLFNCFVSLHFSHLPELHTPERCLKWQAAIISLPEFNQVVILIDWILEHSRCIVWFWVNFSMVGHWNHQMHRVQFQENCIVNRKMNFTMSLLGLYFESVPFSFFNELQMENQYKKMVGFKAAFVASTCSDCPD